MNEPKQCACGTWFSDTGRGHTQCKPCRITTEARKAKHARRRPRNSSHRPAVGSLEWAEARGGLIGGYEEE